MTSSWFDRLATKLWDAVHNASDHISIDLAAGGSIHSSVRVERFDYRWHLIDPIKVDDQDLETSGKSLDHIHLAKASVVENIGTMIKLHFLGQRAFTFVFKTDVKLPTSCRASAASYVCIPGWETFSMELSGDLC